MTEKWPSSYNDHLRDNDLEARVSTMLNSMSVEQKVGQMIQPDIRYISPEEVGEFQIGSVLSGGGAPPNENPHSTIEDWLALADHFYDAAEAHGCIVPPAWGIDALHGNNNLFGATLFPHNIGLGAARNPNLVRKIAEATAVEVAVTGLDWTFAPTLAVALDGRWGRTYESFSQCTELVTELTESAITGYQGEVGSSHFLKGQHIIATAKHYLADGGTENGVDQGNAICDEKELWEVHGRPYAEAVRAGVQVVMASFSSWQGDKLHGHTYLLQHILKDTMGFDGFIISDWNGHGQLSRASNVSGDEAVNAGIDVLMAPEDWRELLRNTLADISEGRISANRIDDAVRRILRVKIRAGLTFPNRPSKRLLAGKKSKVGSEANRQLARQAVRESAVLLKNTKGLLPLKRKLRVMVTGSGADNLAMQSGGWSLTWQGDHASNSDFPGSTSIFQAVCAEVSSAGGFAELVSEPGHDDAERFDAAIVIFGEKPYAEGYGDTSHLSYSSNYPDEAKHLQLIKTLNIPVISVLLHGRPLWTNPELNASNAFIAAGLPGTEGAGLTDLIFSDGEYDFTGRLSFNWPESPTHNPAEMSTHPLFPIGYGLSLKDQDSLGSHLSEDDQTLISDESSRICIFQRRPLSPFTLYVGDEADWHMPVFGRTFSSVNDTVRVQSADWQRQEDVRNIRWHGEAGQIFFRSDYPLDIRPLTEKGVSIEATLCLHRKPDAPVILRLDSDHPDCASIDITDQLNSLDLETWQTLIFETKDFQQAGMDDTGVRTPFLLFTDGPLEISLAEVWINRP